MRVSSARVRPVRSPGSKLTKVSPRDKQPEPVVNLAKPFTAYTPADYAVAEVSLAGFFWLTQRAIAEMAIRYGGHVVSVLAATADTADSGAPAVLAALTRGSQVAATTSLAREYASLGIRVNAVVPGLIEAPRFPARSCAVYDGRFHRSWGATRSATS